MTNVLFLFYCQFIEQSLSNCILDLAKLLTNNLFEMKPVEYTIKLSCKDFTCYTRRLHKL